MLAENFSGFKLVLLCKCLASNGENNVMCYSRAAT